MNESNFTSLFRYETLGIKPTATGFCDGAKDRLINIGVDSTEPYFWFLALGQEMFERCDELYLTSEFGKLPLSRYSFLENFENLGLWTEAPLVGSRKSVDMSQSYRQGPQVSLRMDRIKGLGACYPQVRSRINNSRVSNVVDRIGTAVFSGPGSYIKMMRLK